MTAPMDALRRLLLAGAGAAAAPAGGAARPLVADAIRDAFVAFYPAYEIARLRWLAVDDPGSPRRLEPNAFGHARRLLDARARTVTAPNNDTLYSSAWLDLHDGPVTLSMPAMPGRYWSVQVMNAHTDNVAILGRRTDGDGPLSIVLAGPRAGAQAGAPRVVVDTNDAWLLARVAVDGPDDLAAVAALQDRMSLLAPPRPGARLPRRRPPKDAGPPDFVDVVGEALAHNPPIGATAAHAQRARAAGIAPGARWSALDAPLRDAWSAAWPAMVAALRTAARPAARRVGGWIHPPPGVGRWGDDLELRAAVALGGIAALSDDEALYLRADTGPDGSPLDGRHRWRVRVPPGGLPVDAFWSLTMYQVEPDGRAFLVPNPIDRHSVGDRTRGLAADADGSIELLLQAEPPANPANWLPAPPGPFRLSLRAYLPRPELREGRAALPEIVRA